MSATDLAATRRASSMTRSLALLFAVAAGAAVGNLYLAQPLLDDIASDLHASASNAGWLITATQIGYAVGVLLIVPLGDVRNRRHLDPDDDAVRFGARSCSARWRRRSASCSSRSACSALTTVAGQILAPLAGDLADNAAAGASSAPSSPGSSRASSSRGR